jgi:hypothetical protein
MRVPREQFRALDLEAHAVLSDVPLRDVTAIDLPGGGSMRTITDVRTLLTREKLASPNGLVRGLFALRRLLGRVLGWDSEERVDPQSSYVHRLSDNLKARSAVPPGTAEGRFKLLYVLERESVAEARNATVHAFICSALEQTSSGYRLYWGVYVKPVSWLTPLYMGMIEPFRRFVVYPSIFRRIRRAWVDRYREDRRRCQAVEKE